MMSVFYFIVCVISIILRVAPRILWKDFNGTDAHFHFYYVNLIKNNNHALPKKEPRVLGGTNECTYPFFYHWLLSYFSEKFLNFWDKFSGFIFDFFSGIFILLLLHLKIKLSFNESCLFLASYIIAPGLTFSFIGPRPYSLTPRNFSQFIFFLGSLNLIFSLSSDELIFTPFILAALFFSILILSSQFGVQVLLCLVLSSIFDWRIGGCLVAGVCLAFIISKGFLITQVKAHIHHLQWYFKFNYSFIQHKSNFSKLISLFKKRDVRGIFYEIVFYNQLFTSIIRHFTYFIALFFGLFSFIRGSVEPFQQKILFILIALFVPFVITNFGKARLLGEAERYIEFAYPLQTLLFLTLVSRKFLYFILVFTLFFNMIWYFYNLYQIKSQFASKYSYENLYFHLNKGSVKLLCLNNNESYIFLNTTKVNLVGFLVNISLKQGYGKFFKKFFSRYPMVNPKYLKEICEEFDVTHILESKQNKSSQKYYYDQIINATTKLSNIYEDERYILYAKNKY